MIPCDIRLYTVHSQRMAYSQGFVFDHFWFSCLFEFGVQFLCALVFFFNSSHMAAKLNKRYHRGLYPIRDFVCCCLDHLNIWFDVSISSKVIQAILCPAKATSISRYSDPCYFFNHSFFFATRYVPYVPVKNLVLGFIAECSSILNTGDYGYDLRICNHFPTMRLIFCNHVTPTNEINRGKTIQGIYCFCSLFKSVIFHIFLIQLCAQCSVMPSQKKVTVH
jgi:hypothetical protein